LWVFEIQVLKRIFVPKKEEMAGGWRRLHNEELHNLYASPDTVWVTNSGMIMWARHVGRMGQMENAY
jgi:hypothetical protein